MIPHRRQGLDGMFDRLIGLIERAPIWLVAAAGVVIFAAIGVADYLTGAQLSLSVFYLLPIALLAWRAGRGWPSTLSLASAIAWYVANRPGSLEMGFSQATLLWNTATRLGFFLIVSSLVSSLRRVLERERGRANTDPLTGLLNRRLFYQKVALELERTRRYRRPLSMIYLDLDGFKALNDQHGHSAGDRTLQAVSRCLAASVRANDIVARLGGDEFGVALPEADPNAAQAAAAKLQRQIQEGFADARPVGLCLGVVTCLQAPDSVENLIELADQLMYAAKRSGGSRMVHQVVGAEPLGE